MKHLFATYGLAAISVLALAGCKNSLLDRSLIFTTNTTTGLEISANPAQAAGSPVKFVIGYKRQELAIVPVYDRYGTTAIGTVNNATAPSEAGKGAKYRLEAYSVIAKIASNIGGRVNASNSDSGLDGHLNNAQWFATGQAAKSLATQPGIVGAVVGSPSVAQASAQAKLGLSGLEGEGRAYAMASLSLLYESLNEVRDKDPVAASIVVKLDLAASQIPLPKLADFQFYAQIDANDNPIHALQPISNVETRLSALHDFQKLMAISKLLRSSAEAIKLASSEKIMQIVDASGATQIVDDVQPLKDEAIRQRATDNALAKALSQNPTFKSAITEFYTRYILRPVKESG